MGKPTSRKIEIVDWLGDALSEFRILHQRWAVKYGAQSF